MLIQLGTWENRGLCFGCRSCDSEVEQWLALLSYLWSKSQRCGVSRGRAGLVVFQESEIKSKAMLEESVSCLHVRFWLVFSCMCLGQNIFPLNYVDWKHILKCILYDSSILHSWNKIIQMENNRFVAQLERECGYGPERDSSGGSFCWNILYFDSVGGFRNLCIGWNCTELRHTHINGCR